MKKEMTKAELIDVIGKKVKRLKPHFRESFMRRLKYKTKAELIRMATHMKVKVDKAGYDITF